MNRRDWLVRGHAIVKHGEGDYRCKCGVSLRSVYRGSGRCGARDAMHFHRLDLNQAVVEAPVSAGKDEK